MAIFFWYWPFAGIFLGVTFITGYFWVYQNSRYFFRGIVRIGLEPSVELIVVVFLFSFNSSISAVHQFNDIKVKTEPLLEIV